jgi:hypothetical protein
MQLTNVDLIPRRNIFWKTRTTAYPGLFYESNSNTAFTCIPHGSEEKQFNRFNKTKKVKFNALINFRESVLASKVFLQPDNNFQKVSL